MAMKAQSIIHTALVLLVTAASAHAQTRAPNSATLPAELTLKQALELALVNSSILRDAQANLRQVSGQYEQYRSALLPQIGANVRQGYLTLNLQGFGIDLQQFPRVLGPSGSMDARVTFSQDLLNISSLRSWQSYNSQRDSARFLVANAREVVTLNVVAAYLQSLRAKASKDTLTEQTKLANELYTLTNARFQQGAASELDANRSKQEANSLEQQRQEAEQSYVASKLNLATLIQVNVTSDFEVSDPAAYGSGGTMEKGTSLQAAFASRPDYRAAVATVRAAELQVKSARATRLPEFRLFFSDGQSGDSPVHNVNVYDLQGALFIPIFTGGRISGEVHEAEGLLETATSDLDRNRAQIEGEVLTAISGVEWALKEVETSAQNVDLSRRELELTRARFLQGVADNTEVVNAQERLSRADDARIRAQYTLGLARANLTRAIGGAERAYRK
jgi:outer membrane protein TolC